MEKQRGIQLELFSNSASAGVTRDSRSGSFLARISAYEKTILLVIGLIVTGIVSFGLGVERGKRINIASGNIPQHKNEANKIEIREEVYKPRVPQIKPQPDPAPVKKDSYTIQLASYSKESFANKEADKLKSKGFAPLVIGKGNYTILCVGYFADREKARGVLIELKKKYKDCYVRRL